MIESTLAYPFFMDIEPAGMKMQESQFSSGM